jgi:hypothetical protein
MAERLEYLAVAFSHHRLRGALHPNTWENYANQGATASIQSQQGGNPDEYFRES